MAKVIQQAMVYKLAIVVGIFFMVNALSTTCAAAFINTDWNTLTYSQKFVICCTILASFSNTMLAFFNKTLSRIEQGKQPIETGDTQPPFKPEIKA